MRICLLLGFMAVLVGCGNSQARVRQKASVRTVTFPIAFGNYSRVYNTTYHIVNRYAVIKRASYKQGVIEAELSQDTSLFDKTRRTILARLFEADDYWDVECRVLIEVEDGDVETLGSIQPRYRWRTIAADQFLETRLNNEIKAALTGGAWQSKAPLTYQSEAALPAPKGIRFKREVKESPQGASDKKAEEQAQRVLKKALERSQEDAPHASRTIAHKDVERGLNAREYERLGVHFFGRSEFRKAENAFLSALELDKSSATGAYLLAHTRFALGRYEAAAAALQQGYQKGASWEDAKMDLRSFYGDLQVFNKHIETLEGHLALNKTDLDARLVLGWVRFFTGDYQSARDALAIVTLSRPEDGAAKHFLRKANIKIALSSGNLREF